MERKKAFSLTKVAYKFYIKKKKNDTLSVR